MWINFLPLEVKSHVHAKHVKKFVKCGEAEITVFYLTKTHSIQRSGSTGSPASVF